MVNLWYEGSMGGSTAIDKGALKTHLDSLVDVAESKELVLTDLVGVLAAAPDIFTTPRVEDETVLSIAIKEVFENAVQILLEMREREGEAMSEELLSLANGLERRVAELDEACRQWPKLAMKRLRDRLDILTNEIELDVKIDRDRIAAEAAFLADRADVTEEITRLESHLKQLKSTVTAEGPIGRKLEFLIQELGREANTVASKTALPKVAEAVIEIKADLEKVREIAQNVE
jgi:uncharacterized protein (TIGR00255 family)